MEIKDSKYGFILRFLQEIGDQLLDNVDVEVILAGGERYTATFMTSENLKAILERYKTTGECLSGKYFWTTNMILVEDLNPATLQKVVGDLLQKGELFNAFAGPHDD